MDQVSQGTFLRSKQTVTVAIELLNWLTDHGTDLRELEQEHLDAWQATGPSTRLIADRFLSWAIKTRLVGPDLKILPHRRGTSPRMNAKDQEEAVQRVVHSDEFTPRDRAAAILVLVFGRQIEDVVGLTWDDINVTYELVTIQIGSVEIALPAPLDGPWRCLAANPGNDLTAAHPNSNWVFRGYSPGRHVDPGHLRNRLQQVHRAFNGRNDDDAASRAVTAVNAVTTVPQTTLCDPGVYPRLMSSRLCQLNHGSCIRSGNSHLCRSEPRLVRSLSVMS